MDTTSAAFPIIFVAFIVLLVAGLIVALVIYSNKKAAERRNALAQAAAQMGWTFAADAVLSMIPGLERHHLFSQGHSKKLYNMLYGAIDSGRAAIFDYQYTVGHGKHQSTFNQSVIYFQSTRLDLPFFSLRPESFGHKLISAFGYQDIDFSNRPTFSGKYLLRGHDEAAIRRVFHDEVLSYYEQNLRLCTDGGANEIFFYRLNVRVEPSNVQALRDWGLNMLTLFQRT